MILANQGIATHQEKYMFFFRPYSPFPRALSFISSIRASRITALFQARPLFLKKLFILEKVLQSFLRWTAL
jgi:hypothetical protein